MSRKPLNDVELLAGLKAYADLLGETPSAARVKKDSRHLSYLASLKTYINHFGTFNKALELAGITPRPCRNKKWRERNK